MSVLIRSAVHAILRPRCNETFTENAEKHNGKGVYSVGIYFLNHKDHYTGLAFLLNEANCF